MAIIPRGCHFVLQVPPRRPLFPLGFLLFALSAGCCAVPVAGRSLPDTRPQEKPHALIFGTVWGPDNRPVYGVKVRIRRAQDHKPKWELYSDHNGEFAQRVPAGQADYVVWADLKGFKSQNGKHLQAGTEVTVHIENDERADIGLHLK